MTRENENGQEEKMQKKYGKKKNAEVKNNASKSR